MGAGGWTDGWDRARWTVACSTERGITRSVQRCGAALVRQPADVAAAGRGAEALPGRSGPGAALGEAAGTGWLIFRRAAAGQRDGIPAKRSDHALAPGRTRE